MSFLSTRNQGPERLMALGPVGCFFALILGRDGHLSTIPLLIGGLGGLVGLAFKIAHRNKIGEAL